MKILKLMLALSISAAMITSCDNSDKKQNEANPLIGQWNIDSVASKDSNGIGLLLLAMSLPDRDSGKYDLSFASDTVTLHLKDTVTKTAYSFNASKNEVLIHADSTNLTFQKLNDSTISLTAKDSKIFFLKKE